MSDSPSLSDRYLQLIDQIVQVTLKGQIRSKEQVYQMLVEGVTLGTVELFERGLEQRITVAQHQSETQSDEFKQAKAVRSLRALQTIRGEWQRWQTQNQATEVLTTAVQRIVMAERSNRNAPLQENRLQIFLRVLDPNQPQALNLSQWKQLAKLLAQQAQQTNDGIEKWITSDSLVAIQQLSQGLTQGLEDWYRLEDHLVSWIYDQSQTQLGFEGTPGQRGPWTLWAKQVGSSLPQSLFQAMAMEQSVMEWAERQSMSLSALVELVIVLRCLQQGLVTWFDKLVYDSKAGAKLSISTFLGFAVIWSQLAAGLNRAAAPFSQGDSTGTSREQWANGCFQVTLQILRAFSQRDYFPLYGGVFASFSGEYLRNALTYLDEPLRRTEGTQEKARILTLLGSSLRAQGQNERATAFHQEALEIAREAGDRTCEIANLNHLSRTCVAQSNYAEAINYSQRAIILSRQTGDRLGEVNALANLGYSEVFQAQRIEAAPEVYETAMNYLEQGLQMSERLGDRQSEALCLSSLGISKVMLDEAQEAIVHLERGIRVAQFSGDLYLQGINLTYLAEAHYRLQHYGPTLQAACLGMYLLEQIASTSWRQPAGLLTVLQGHLGEATFQELLVQQRSQIIAAIGVDGYDHLPKLLEQYRK